MLFPDGLHQPDLFIAEQLPHRLRNSVAARVNSAIWCVASSLPCSRWIRCGSDGGHCPLSALDWRAEQIRLYNVFNMPLLFSKQRQTGAVQVTDSYQTTETQIRLTGIKIDVDIKYIFLAYVKKLTTEMLSQSSLGTDTLDLSQGYITQTKASQALGLHSKSCDQSWRPLWTTPELD